MGNKVKVDQSLEELIPKFLKLVREDLEEMKKAVANQDPEGVRRMGHKIKGSSNGFGLLELGSMSEKMEGLSKQADWDGMNKLFPEMIDYLDNVEIEYVEEEDDDY